ncbi:hypothetical protein [Aeromonas molluscorum]|uniref:hypothetical protein n=1 Tax=Aeromonas molluscorum TaxID=271417 RepID=UPI003F1D192B
MKQKKEINWEYCRWLKQHLKHLRQSPLPDEPQAKITGFLTIIFAAIPLITAGIYITGMAYHLGECFVNGLDPLEFPWPADYTLAWGYVQLLDALRVYVWPVGDYIIFAVLLFIVWYLWIELRLALAWFYHRCSLPLSRTQKLRFRKELRRRVSVPTPRIFFLFTWFKIIYDRFAILVVPSLLVLLLGMYSFSEGKVAATEQAERLERGQLTAKESTTVHSPLLDQTPHIRLMCNTIQCAYLLKGGLIRLVRHDQVEQVTWMVPKDTSDNSSKESSTEK